MEGHCSTVQSPQWAVVPMEEEEEEEEELFIIGRSVQAADSVIPCDELLFVRNIEINLTYINYF